MVVHKSDNRGVIYCGKTSKQLNVSYKWEAVNCKHCLALKEKLNKKYISRGTILTEPLKEEAEIDYDGPINVNNIKGFDKNKFMSYVNKDKYKFY